MDKRRLQCRNFKFNSSSTNITEINIEPKLASIMKEITGIKDS